MRRAILGTSAAVFATAAMVAAVPASATSAATSTPVTSTTSDVDRKGAAANVRMNQIQYMGAHNGYHRELSDKEKVVQLQLDKGARNLYYSHATIDQMLSHQGIRGIELDLYPDPQGGLYTKPLVRTMAGLGPITDPDMAKPGIKVLHMSDFDYRTTCATFVRCLQQVQDWSRRNPNHAPIALQLELKSSDKRAVAAGGVQSPPWDAAQLDTIDDEIRSVFAGDKIITPDSVRRDKRRTLEQNVLTKGWPLLKDARGKVFFFFDNGGPGAIRDAYTKGRPNLEGRAVFTRGTEGSPDAAITMVNDPRGANAAQITRLVRKGYVVRTRSDEPLATIDQEDYSRLPISLASGAQLVTTDFPAEGMAARWDSDFVAKLPEGFPVRCNPVNAPRSCVTSKLGG